ncbi:MAG: DEAD/DEAH box helicase [Bacteroidaceae bacterium]|nr:DEAD/DEAH box helicase [Bacteroidaceae bacterium]
MSTGEILKRLGIDVLNAMQQDAMQAYRKADSMVLLSPTGSGKTLAYLLPLLESLDEGGGCQGLVIVPSRELAMQTSEVVRLSGTPLKCVALYGGRPAMEEHRTLRGLQPQLIVGTPGRLLDHLTKGNIDATNIRVLVIDEFDKCLELGFRDEMTQLFSHLSSVTKRVLLSATDNPEITDFLPTYTRLDYLDETSQTERIEQWSVKSPIKDKLETLRSLLLSRGAETSLVFTGFRESVERVSKYLAGEGFFVAALHGGMEQRDRERALFRFVSGAANILVSTDLASRGLDIPELDNVVHYHLPLNEQAFVHRNGRTARWDKTGQSYLLVGPEEAIPDFVRDVRPYTPSPSASRPMPPLWESLYIGKGKKDKLSRGDIAGFFMKAGGLGKEDVGRIDVRDHHSYVAVCRDRTEDVLRRLKGLKIKGMKTIIERTR